MSGLVEQLHTSNFGPRTSAAQPRPAHPAGTESGLDFVSTEPRASSERHGLFHRHLRLQLLEPVEWTLSVAETDRLAPPAPLDPPFPSGGANASIRLSGDQNTEPGAAFSVPASSRDSN